MDVLRMIEVQDGVGDWDRMGLNEISFNDPFRHETKVKRNFLKFSNLLMLPELEHLQIFKQCSLLDLLRSLFTRAQ